MRFVSFASGGFVDVWLNEVQSHIRLNQGAGDVRYMENNLDLLYVNRSDNTTHKGIFELVEFSPETFAKHLECLQTFYYLCKRKIWIRHINEIWDEQIIMLILIKIWLFQSLRWLKWTSGRSLRWYYCWIGKTILFACKFCTLSGFACSFSAWPKIFESFRFFHLLKIFGVSLRSK